MVVADVVVGLCCGIPNSIESTLEKIVVGKKMILLIKKVGRFLKKIFSLNFRIYKHLFNKCFRRVNLKLINYKY